MGTLLALAGCSSEAPGAGAAGNGSAGTSASLSGSGGLAGGAGSGSLGGASSGAAGTSLGGQATTGGAGLGNAGIGGAGSAGAAGAQAGGGAGGKPSCDGKAISFNANTGDGNDKAKARVEVDFGDNADLPTGNANRTIEFWAYVLPSSWAGDKNTMFFYGTNERHADGFGLDFGGQQGTIDPFTNAIFDNDDQPTGLNPCQEQWIHFAMTWDGTAVRAFVNGVEKAKKTSSEAQKTLLTGRTALIIGSYPANYFDGSIDEFRIWNVARTAAELTSTMNKALVGNETGLTGYWKFDEPSGTSAADSVTTPGHTAHPGVLMAASPAELPARVAGVPLTCP